MGFKLIREGSKEFREKIKRLKEDQLNFEAKRWAKVTRDSKREEAFIDRFHELAPLNETIDKEKLAKDLSSEILNSKLNLASIQGNSEMEKLLELLN